MNTTDCFATIETRFADWHYDHPKILYGLIRSLKPDVIVEVGTYRGYCACYMARALQENNKGHLYCIDNWSLTEHVARYGDPRAHWEENVTAAGVRDWITILQGESHEVQWPARVDMAYIDGWHSYHTCMSDFIHAEDLGAYLIALDDTDQTVGPRMVCKVLREGFTHWDVMEIHRDCGLTIAKRREPKPAFTFSQELYNHPGTDLRFMSREERQAHFVEARMETGIAYDEEYTR